MLVFDESNEVLARHETTPEGLRPTSLGEELFAPRQSLLEVSFDFANSCHQRGFGSVQNIRNHMLFWIPIEQHPTPALLKMQKLVNQHIDKALHTPQCIEIRQEDMQWVILWPNHCRDCGGYGQFAESYDPSPDGVSLGSGYMTDYEPCAACTEKGICPRCGFLGGLTPEGEGPCHNCFWTYEDGGRPGWKYECECGLAESLAFSQEA